MKSAFELLLERLERSGFTKEAQHLTQNQNASNGASAPTEQPDMPAKLGAFEILGELGEGRRCSQLLRFSPRRRLSPRSCLRCFLRLRLRTCVTRSCS